MNSSITRSRDNRGKILSNPKDISNFQVSFYQQLYSDPRVSQSVDEIPLSRAGILSNPQVEPSLSGEADKPISDQDLFKGGKTDEQWARTV